MGTRILFFRRQHSDAELQHGAVEGYMTHFRGATGEPAKSEPNTAGLRWHLRRQHSRCDGPNHSSRDQCHEE